MSPPSSSPERRPGDSGGSPAPAMELWPEAGEVVEELRAALNSSLQLLLKCEELVAMLRCSSSLQDRHSAILTTSHPRLKSAQQTIGTVLTDVEQLDSCYNVQTATSLPAEPAPAFEPAVEIKIESENLATGTSDFDIILLKEETEAGDGDNGDDCKDELGKLDDVSHTPPSPLPPPDLSDDDKFKLNDVKGEHKKRRKKRTAGAGAARKEKNKPYQCEHCDRILLSLYHLKKHTDAAHTKFVCEECQQTFDSRKDLKAHSRNFHKVNLKNFVCQVCGYTCHDLGPFNRHMIWHSDNRLFKCQHCGRAFHIKYHLDQHLRIHTGEKPYECEVCGKQFSRDSHLTRHRVTHSGEKNYSCSMCSKSFTLRENMKRHMKIHENVKENQNP